MHRGGPGSSVPSRFYTSKIPTSTYPRYGGGGGGPNSPPHRHHGLNNYSDSETSSTHSVRVSRLIEKIKQSQNASPGTRGLAKRDYITSQNPDAFSYVNNNVNSNNDLIYSRVERAGAGDSVGKRTVRERHVPRETVLPHHHHQFSSSPSKSPGLFFTDYHENGTGSGSNTGLGGQHKTTVLLNNDSSGLSDDLYSGRYTSRTFPSRSGGLSGNERARYFGEETDYEYDRVLSNRFKEQYGKKSVGEMHNNMTTTTATNSSNNLTHNHSQQNMSSSRSSVPKIILHEEAVAEIPNGKSVSGPGTRSPSIGNHNQYDQEYNNNVGTLRQQKKQEKKTTANSSRFLGGFLTLKRNKNKKNSTNNGGEQRKLLGGSSAGSAAGTLRSTTRSPPPTIGAPPRRSGSFLNVPSPSFHRNHHHDPNDSSSPKYYVPYHRSTPTLYESPRYERDRMSSAGGSVLSNGSYVNKHVSRSWSMKHPWEPRHPTNEINYYNDQQYGKQQRSSSQHHQQEESSTTTKKRSTLSRSKSMPGKKLTSLIGNWVSKGTLKRNERAGNRNDTSRARVDEDDEDDDDEHGNLIRGNRGGMNKSSSLQQTSSTEQHHHQRTNTTSTMKRGTAVAAVPGSSDKRKQGGSVTNSPGGPGSTGNNNSGHKGSGSLSANWGKFTLFRKNKNKQETNSSNSNNKRGGGSVHSGSTTGLIMNRDSRSPERPARKGDYNSSSGSYSRASPLRVGGGGGGDFPRGGGVGMTTNSNPAALRYSEQRSHTLGNLREATTRESNTNTWRQQRGNSTSGLNSIGEDHHRYQHLHHHHHQQQHNRAGGYGY